jgi:hypothetical protein
MCTVEMNVTSLKWMTFYHNVGMKCSVQRSLFQRHILSYESLLLGTLWPSEVLLQRSYGNRIYFFIYFLWPQAWSLNPLPRCLHYEGRVAGFEPELVKPAALPRYQWAIPALRIYFGSWSYVPSPMAMNFLRNYQTKEAENQHSESLNPRHNS